MADFFRQMVKDLGDDYTYIADDGLHSAEFSGWVDTGSYSLNALLSGSIYNGMPNNKVLALAGDPATGKTFFALGIMREFMKSYEGAGAYYSETEGAVTKEMMKERNIATERVILSEPSTIEEFRSKAVNFLDKYLKSSEKERPPIIAVLDSLGMLSSLKEVADVTDDKRNKSGEGTKDMTKAGLIRGAFRVLRLKLARAQIPMIVTCHTYAAIGSQSHEKELGGGQGLKYAADQIVTLSKSKDYDDDEVQGVIIKCKMYKGRMTKENKVVAVRLNYDTGLDRYYGLLDIAEKYGIFKKVSTKYQLPDGRLIFGKTINNNPQKYYTKEILDLIDEACGKEFKYGKGEDVKEKEELDEGFADDAVV